MTFLGVFFTVVVGALLFCVPLRWAAVPLVVGAAYMTRGQILDIGPLHFHVIRILVVIGLARVMVKGERLAGGVTTLDRLLLLWGVWFICSSFFHTSDTLVTRLGVALTELGSYFLFRVFLRNADDVYFLFKAFCILTLPLAIAMLVEKVTGTNAFAALGGVYPEAAVRDGHFRAQGPFAHAIFAGTFGAACVPTALFVWRSHRTLGIIGLLGAVGIVFASGSSGPAMMLVLILALAAWKIRRHLRGIFSLVILAIIALAIVMNDPVYYVLARIDVTGGSTGWHRAALIDSALRHLGEWWLIGTDYTRHWMPTGIHANDNHTDITNHYLQMGVSGGIALMLIFVAVLSAAFSKVGRTLGELSDESSEQQIMIWILGSILFGHAMNFVSISYFDQSVVFFYLVLAGIAAASLIATAPACETLPIAETIDSELAPASVTEANYVHLVPINLNRLTRHASSNGAAAHPPEAL